MKNTCCAILIFSLIATTSLFARTWTDVQGRKVEAEVVKVNSDKTVALRTNRGKTITVAFDTFVVEDVEYLEELISNKARAELHAVPWNKLNEVFGAEIWQDALLWDDPTSEIAQRMKLKKESKTDFMENYRAYPFGRQNILSEAVYAIALYGGQQYVDSLSFIFLNQGDVLPETTEKEMGDQIKESGMRVHDALIPWFGKPERDSLGKGDLREKVWRWEWNGHAIMLSLQEGKYVALRIMTTDRADLGGRSGKVKDEVLQKRMAACVERRENGDVVIGNIPMVNQGPKGYCSPATWERYLRYMEIPVDMYLLALAANTGAGGGTQGSAMVAATENIIGSNGRKLKTIHAKPSVKGISKYIDKGLPVMWTFISTPDFQRAANTCTALRNGRKPREKQSGQVEDSRSGGHICLIIGYNSTRNEISISDSWGSRFSERWVPVEIMEKLSYGTMNVIRW